MGTISQTKKERRERERAAGQQFPKHLSANEKGGKGSGGGVGEVYGQKVGIQET